MVAVGGAIGATVAASGRGWEAASIELGLECVDEHGDRVLGGVVERVDPQGLVDKPVGLLAGLA
jgi:hypothetical protein